MIRNTLVRAVLALTVLAVPACSGQAAEPSATHNAADVRFAQGMIPHHTRAVEMAGLAEGRTTNATVLDLAGRVAKAQDPEIAVMTGWLENWGEPTAPADHSAHDMDESDMTALREAEGEAFDRQWLSMMITHHEGAVAMSEKELAEGADPAAKDLASRIVEAQRGEIDEMHALLPQG